LGGEFGCVQFARKNFNWILMSKNNTKTFK